MYTMARVQYRLGLPFGHILVDSILLLALIAFPNRMFHPKKNAYSQRTSIPAEGVEFDLRSLPPPGPYMLLATGNPLAGVISSALRPEAGIVTSKHPSDPFWFLLLQTISLPCWFLIGRWVDLGASGLGKAMIAYLFVRSFLAIAGVYDIGSRIQMLFWCFFVVWLISLGLYRLALRGMRFAREKAAPR